MESNNILLCVLNYLKGKETFINFTSSIFDEQNSEKLKVFELLCNYYKINPKEYMETIREELRSQNIIEIDYCYD